MKTEINPFMAEEQHKAKKKESQAKYRSYYEAERMRYYENNPGSPYSGDNIFLSEDVSIQGCTGCGKVGCLDCGTGGF